MHVTAHISSAQRSAAFLAAVAVRLSGLSILLGGLAKLFFGTPGSLPDMMRRLMYWNEQGLFTFVIAAEVFVGIAALIAPRLSWPAATLFLVAFLVVLIDQVADGAATCGCFGTAFEAPPWMMLAIDGALLLTLMFARPWSALSRAPWRWWALVPAAVGSGCAVAMVNLAVLEPPDSESTADIGEPAIPPGSGAPTDGPKPPRNAGTTDSQSDATTEAPPIAPTWRLPDRFPRYVVLRPSAWIGQPIGETVLAPWADTSQFPPDATVIFYMDTCSHCAAHLRAAADHPSNTDYVLIRLPTPRDSTLPTLVDAKPAGLRVDLPRGTTWDMRVPWEMTLTDGVVTSARYLGD